MAGESILPTIVRGDEVPYSAFAMPIPFPGSNTPCVKSNGTLGVAPGVSVLIRVPPPVGRTSLDSTQEAVVHSLNVVRLGRVVSG